MQCNNSYIGYYELVKTISAYDNPTDNCFFRRREPNMLVFAIYAFVIPSLAIFGLCANFINAIVFMRPKMTPSAFTYLAALAWLDCLSCLFITLTALSRSIFFYSNFWLAYDLKWQTPLFGITTGAANLVLACVSIDRLIYLKRGLPNGTPRFCRRNVARRMIIAVIFISGIVNFPYFFVFIVNNDGTFQTTDFYYSQYYKIHNWFSFILLCVLPAIFLLIGNAAILIAFRRWTKQSKKCQKQCNTSGKNTQKRYQHQMKLTITILIVVTLYLIGELPAHLTSRKSALNLLYSGDMNKVDFRLMERLEIICITLNSIQLSMNIMVYALINPSFIPEFFICLRGASDTCFRICCCNAFNIFFKDCVCFKQKEINNNNIVEELPVESNSWSDEDIPKVDVEIQTDMKTKETSLTEIKSWKRAHSWCNLAFINQAFDYEIEENNNLENSIQKRHSMPAYLRKENEKTK